MSLPALPLKLSAADLAKLPHRSLRAKAHDGKEAAFDGIELGDVLKLAGVKFGEQLRGKDLALFLVVGASDGYRAVFALPELDHAFTDRIIILADRRDGKPLAEKEGPLRIVVPDEKRYRACAFGPRTADRAYTCYHGGGLRCSRCGIGFPARLGSGSGGP